ncbi:MAG: Dam family site-specific DNA-(adenine-N6)-methyltransferase [Holophagales bacterium]|jgi:DNA adenine methylase|nr:Dam family site-specific DNA-(adenine-N6)-methyltransferase [Holophagales bacterium]
MNGRIPHIVQYQGSKRLLASHILEYMPRRFNNLFEPFAGMAAITIAASKQNRAERYHINDINEPIVCLLRAAIDTPSDLVERYTNVWEGQFHHPMGHIKHFYHIRDSFNADEQTAENMLYLLARCVKGSVRYGKNGKFNQSPDKRRHGVNPQKIAENVHAISALLKGKVSFTSLDYKQILEIAEPGDIVYMDPPYQGVSSTKDNRYLAGVDYNAFSSSIETLDERGVDYIISYDGECGDREYGNELPVKLNCTKFLLNAGLSTQATLLGRRDTTFEALYVSKSLVEMANLIPKQTLLVGCAI